jgi:hypothetical protein
VWLKDSRCFHLVFPGLVQKQIFTAFEVCWKHLNTFTGAEHSAAAAAPAPFAWESGERKAAAAADEAAAPLAQLGRQGVLPPANKRRHGGAGATPAGPDPDPDGAWSIFDAEAELRRLGVTGAAPSGGRGGSRWRLTRVNSSFLFCPTYPRVFAVPACISDRELLVARHFRSKARVPALSWRHPGTGVSIVRASQPHVGIGGQHCAVDIKLVQAVAQSSPVSRTMVIVDARPWRNAMAQKTVLQVRRHSDCTATHSY